MKEKMTFTNGQVAFEYAIYMMVSSYFKKAVCANPLFEKKLCVQFHEQKSNNQYRMEEMALSYVKTHLAKEIPSSVWKEEMQVHFIPEKKSGKTEIRFMNDQYILRLFGDYCGKASVIKHEFWAKPKQSAKENEKDKKRTAAKPENKSGEAA